MAMFENSELLDREIERLTNKLADLDPTTQDYETVRKSLDQLYKLRNEQYRTDTEDMQKRDLSEAELTQKASELEVRRLEAETAQKKLEAETKQREAELAVKQQELALAQKKLEAETKQKEAEQESRKCEIELSEKLHADDITAQKKNRIHDYVVTGLNTAVGVIKLAAVLGFSLLVADQGYRFEETGVPTSKTFREQSKNAFDLLKDAFKSKS